MSFERQNISAAVFKVLVGASLIVIAAVPHAFADSAFKTLYRFKGPPHDGATPVGGLVADREGNLYGVTFKGGAHNKGTVFVLAPPVAPNTVWKKTILHHFAGYPTDGRGPMAGLVLHRGRLYGTTFYDGTVGISGTVYRLSPPKNGTTWTYELLYSFNDVPDGYSPHTNVVIDDDGAVYGFTYGGGTKVGTLYKLMPARKSPWPEMVLYNFTGDASTGEIKVINGAGRPIWNKDGAIVTTSFNGGYYDRGTVFQFAPTDTQPTILYDFTGFDEYWPENGVVAGADGTLYGTTSRGGNNTAGTVFMLTPPVAPATAWTHTKLYDVPRGSEPYGDASPSGVILDRHGALLGSVRFGGTRGAGYVYKLTPPVVGQTDWTRTTLYDFRGGGDGARPGDLLLGKNSVLYGTTYEGGTACNCGTVFMIEP